MNTGFGFDSAGAGFGIGNGGSSSSFSNLSALAPPFTLDRSVTKPFSSPLVDITEPPLGVPPNWVPSTSKTSDFDWLPFSTGSRYHMMMEPSDSQCPLLGRLTVSSTDPSLYDDSSDGLTTCIIGKAKPYYPSSYASTSCHKPQPTYDWLSNSHVAATFSCGSSGSERSVEEATHSIDMLDLNNCNDFVREYPNEEFSLEQQVNNFTISNMDAHSAFPGCHPKTKTPPSSSHNSQFLKKSPYQKILRDQNARLSVTTSIVNSPATFSIRPPVVSTDSFVWNIGPCHISDYGYDSFEAEQGGNHLSNLKEFLPVNSESKEFFSTENHDTCIDKNDPVITESSSIKIHDLGNNIHSVKDSPDRRSMAGMGLRIPDASPHFSLDLKTIETARAIESSSESLDQYNLAAVDSPCWKGAPISRMSPFQAFEIVTPSRVKTVEVCNSANLSLSQVPPSTAEDTVKVFVREPNESTIGSSLEKGATISPKIPSVVGSSLPAAQKTSDYLKAGEYYSAQKTSDYVKAGEYYSKMGCFHPATGSIHEPVEDGGDFYSSYSMPQNKYVHDLMSGKRIAPTSCMEKHAHARSNSDNSSENGLNHLSFYAAEHVQNLPSELVKAYQGESISKVDIRILVDTLHSLSELLLAYCSNGLDALHQKEVKSLETVMNNLDVCINRVGSQVSLSPEQRTSQNLEQFHQLHSNVGVLKSQSQMTKIEGENLECLSKNRNGVEETDQSILSVKKDKEVVDSLYLRNGIDSKKEDSMTKALKKVMRENFHDEEEHPQILLYKNLWLEAEAAFCASNLRARFNSAKSKMEKHESPKVREHAKNWDKLLVSDVSPGSNTIAKLASKTKAGSTSFVSIQTSPAVSVSSHAADDVITRFHILKCRDDEGKRRDVKNSGTPSDFEVSVEQDMVEKSALDEKQTAILYIRDMESSLPTSKVKGNDSGPALPSMLTRSSHIDDDVMSRFQILKSRDECICSLNAGKVQNITSSNCSEIDLSAPEGNAVHSPGISRIHHPIADNKNEVDNLDAFVQAKLNVLRSRGNNISSTPAGEQIQLQEVEKHNGTASKREHWPIVENKVNKGGLVVEMDPFLLRVEAGRESRSHVESKLAGGGGGCSDGSSDWEHVLWCE